MEIADEPPIPRRSLRRIALTELNEASETPNKTTSPDEMIIIQRGPRRKPITWSPVEYDRSKIMQPSRDKTPERNVIARPEMNSKLRRRLIMSPSKNPSEDLGLCIAKKLRSLQKSRDKELKM